MKSHHTTAVFDTIAISVIVSSRPGRLARYLVQPPVGPGHRPNSAAGRCVFRPKFREKFSHNPIKVHPRERKIDVHLPESLGMWQWRVPRFSLACFGDGVNGNSRQLIAQLASFCKLHITWDIVLSSRHSLTVPETPCSYFLQYYTGLLFPAFSPPRCCISGETAAETHRLTAEMHRPWNATTETGAAETAAHRRVE